MSIAEQQSIARPVFTRGPPSIHKKKKKKTLHFDESSLILPLLMTASLYASGFDVRDRLRWIRLPPVLALSNGAVDVRHCSLRLLLFSCYSLLRYPICCGARLPCPARVLRSPSGVLAS